MHPSLFVDTASAPVKFAGVWAVFKVTCSVEFGPFLHDACLLITLHVSTLALQVSSLVDLLVYASVWMPWPFAERDVCIQAVGVDMLEEDGALAISFASPDTMPVRWNALCNTLWRNRVPSLLDIDWSVCRVRTACHA